MLNTKNLISIIGLLLLSGCQDNVSSTESVDAKSGIITATQTAENAPEKQQMPATLPYRGTIKYIGLEGGFFGIITDQGEKLLPMNLEQQYLQHGAVIEFSGDYKKGVMTIQQWGKPFTIKELKLIKSGKSVANSSI